MSTLRKDNTGYDLKQLFIGSEGTLGVITKVSILCMLKSQHKSLALLAVQTYEDILKVYSYVRRQLSEYISAFEMIDADSMQVPIDNLKLSPPLGSHPFYVLFEVSGN